MHPSILAQKSAARARLLAAGAPTAADGSGSSHGSTNAAVRAATAEAVDRHLCDHYTRRPGIAPLCQAVAAYLTARGLPTHENDVVISGSVQEARYVALRSLAVGKIVYILAEDAAPYAPALQFAGASAVILESPDELPDAADGLLLVAAGAPGYEELARRVAKSKLAVVADETAAPLGGDTPFAALPEMAARTLTLGSFAGAPGLDAWQVSWFAGPKSLLTPVRDLKQSITICTSAPSQYAALAALAEYAGATKDQVEL
jgi:aspartate/methionine/tyrosine aminotransferase